MSPSEHPITTKPTRRRVCVLLLALFAVGVPFFWLQWRYCVGCPSDGLFDAAGNLHLSSSDCPWLPRDETAGVESRRLHFFFDEAMLHSSNGVRVALHRPTLSGVAFDPLERDDEGLGPSEAIRGLENLLGYPTVIQDGGTVRMYIRCNLNVDWDRALYSTYGAFETARKHRLKTCLLESYDGGKTFKRNLVGQHAYSGWGMGNVPSDSDRFKNHIVFNDEENAAGDNFTPFIDHNPDCPRDERYKAIGGTDSILASDSGVYVYASEDGIRWRKLYEKPWVSKQHVQYNGYDASWFDSQNVAWWDEICHCYRLMARANTAGSLRAFGMQHSPDLQSASDQVVSTLRFKDHPERCTQRNVPGKQEQFYTQNPFRVDGAPRLLFALPMRCDSATSVCDATLLYSFDYGVTWGRMASDFTHYIRSEVTPADSEGGDNQSGFLYVFGAVGTVTGPQGEHSFYMLDGYGTPKQRILRWTTPRHRFAAVQTLLGEGAGWFLSLVMEGSREDRLTVNHHTKGSLSLELRDPSSGEPIPYFTHADFQPMRGDESAKVAQWAPSPTDLRSRQDGLPGRFRVHAKLVDGMVFTLEVKLGV